MLFLGFEGEYGVWQRKKEGRDPSGTASDSVLKVEKMAVVKM